MWPCLIFLVGAGLGWLAADAASQRVEAWLRARRERAARAEIARIEAELDAVLAARQRDAERHDVN